VSTRTTVVICAIILVTVGAVVSVRHFKQAPPAAAQRTFHGENLPPVSPVATEAVRYLHQLRLQGRLPGFKQDEQCIVLMPGHSISETNYPITLELRARKRNVAGPFSYHFRLIKTSADSGWRLQKAWRTDANGSIAEEFPVS
jgi:hypothetical protein